MKLSATVGRMHYGIAAIVVFVLGCLFAGVRAVWEKLYDVLILRPLRGPKRKRLGALAARYRERLARVGSLTRGIAVTEDSPFGAHVCWPRGRALCIFYEADVGENRWTFLVAEVSDRRLPTLQVWPRSRDGPAGVRPGRTGVRGFDTRFQVRPGPDGALPPFPREAAAAFIALADVMRLSPVLEVQPSRCRLYVPRVLEWGRERASFVDLGSRLVDVLLAAFHAGAEAAPIQILEVRLRAHTATETCQICGDDITTDRVACARCDTPHHRACWQYAGGCSVYACRGKETRGP